MSNHIKGQSRTQVTLFPEALDDFVTEDNPIRVIDVFVDELNLEQMGFNRVIAKRTGRPGYHPATILKLYIYGYLNRIQSSRRLQTEANRNIELMWLLERLTPDFKTIADFKRDNAQGIKQACSHFVTISREMGMFSEGKVAIDGSKFKAVNSKPNNFTPQKALNRTDITVLADKGYYSRKDVKATLDLGANPLVPKTDTSGNSKKGLFTRSQFKYDRGRDLYVCPANQELPKSRRGWDDGLEQDFYYSQITCRGCEVREKCTTSKKEPRKMRRWVHEAEVEAMLARLDDAPDTPVIRKQTDEHPFGTIKMWMGATHFLTRQFKKREYRNESSCSGVQHEANDIYYGSSRLKQSHQRAIKSIVSLAHQK